MVALMTPNVVRLESAPELTEQQIHDAAYLRADGRGWEAVAVLLGFVGLAWLALRRAVEGDPRFGPALKRAERGAAKEAEALALRRLRACAERNDDAVAVKAGAVLVEYAAERRRSETQLKVARLRAEVERDKLAARAKPADEPAAGPGPAWPTPQEERARREAQRTEAAAEPNAEVYLWGGNHITNVGAEPDAGDARVYLQRDDSFGRSVFWVVPERAYLASGRGARPIRPEDLHQPLS